MGRKAILGSPLLSLTADRAAIEWRCAAAIGRPPILQLISGPGRTVSARRRFPQRITPKPREVRLAANRIEVAAVAALREHSS